MGALIRASVRFRLLVVALAAALLVIGAVRLREAPVDALPEFTPPYAEIQTEALGLSATEVENLITVPLEADLLNGVEGVEAIRSESLPGLSSIVLVFAPGTDVYRARQLTQERLSQAHALPRVSKPPTLLQPLSSSSRVMMIGLSSDRVSPIEQSVLARWTIRPRLMGVPGVANVAIWGMRDQQVQVLVDPERLRERDVTLDQVIRTAGNAQIVSPLSFLEASTPGSGGFIETPQQRLQVRNVLERLADPEELGKVPVEQTGGRLRLSDVSQIGIGHQPLIGDAVVAGGAGLLLVVEKFPGADTRQVTRDVEAALETLRPGLAGIRTDTSIFRPASYLEGALDNLALALVGAALLLLCALAALLGRWRAVVVALVTVPASLVAAALVLDALGQTFSALAFAGLAVGLALVVDDAVAGADNVARRVREARAAGVPRTAADVVADATHEVRSPLTFATLIALAAIVPVAVMEGRPGAFFAPLVSGYAAAVVAGSLIAVTLAPALWVLLSSRGAPDGGDPPLLRRLRPLYDRALARVLAARRVPFLVAAAFVVAALAALPLLGTSLVPAFKDRDMLVRLEGQPGTSNTRMTELAGRLSRELRSLEGVEAAGAHVGRAVTGDKTVDVQSAEVWVGVEPGADHGATAARIRAVAARVPDVEADVATYSAQRIRDVGALGSGVNDAGADGLSVLTGSDRPLVVRVYGHEPEVLAREAERVRALIAGVDGVVEPLVERPAEQPNLVIEVDLARAQRFGIKPGDVRRAEAALVQGIHVGSVFDDQKVFDVIVQGVPRRSADDVRTLLIDRPGGGHVRLGQVADVRVESAPVAIERDAVSRFADVEAGVSGRDRGAVAADVRRRLAGVAFPLEYHAQVIDETVAEELGASRVAVTGAIALLAAFLLLQAAFGSWRLAAAAFALLPAALSGGVLVLALTGTDLSLGALLGLLAVLGLAVRTTVLSVRRSQALGTVQLAADDRLAPVVTSAIAVTVCFLPLLVLGPRAGLEIAHPLAVALLGGLVTSTAVALFALPAACMRLGYSAGAPGGPVVRQWTPDEAAEAPVVAERR